MTSSREKRKKWEKKKSKTSSKDSVNPSLPIDMMGLPGFEQHLIVRPQYRDSNDPRNLGGPNGLPGQYKIVFTFNRPGFSLLLDNRFSFENGLVGDSHLAITKPAYTEPNLPDADQIRIYANIGNKQLIFSGCPNKQGFLGKIILDSIWAEHFGDAALKAYQALTPAISNISVYLDIPMHVYQMDITELRTNSVRMSLLAPFTETPLFRLPNEKLTEEFRKYASYYREAMNSNSPNYQFLCYYKIIEGIRKRQERLINEAKQRGESILPRPKLIIPQTKKEQIEWLNAIFPIPRVWDDMALDIAFPQKATGRKVNDIVDKELDDIRNKIAHAVLRSGEPTLSIDDALNVVLVNEWLPLTKCIARLLIKEEFPNVFTA